MTLKFVIILQNLIKAYHRKSGKSKYDRKLTELDVETTRIRSRVNRVLEIIQHRVKCPQIILDSSLICVIYFFMRATLQLGEGLHTISPFVPHLL